MGDLRAAGALLSAAQSLQRPSREAVEPLTVRHYQLTAASALSSLGREAGLLVGPAIGGVLIQLVGIGRCFCVDVTGLVVATARFAAMRPYPHTEETTPPSLKGIAEGLRYALRRRDLLGTYVVDIIAMLMAMPVVLFPALAEKVFGHPELLGLLYSVETIGSLLATATSGWTSRVHHHGRAVVFAALTYGAAIGLVGVAPGIGGGATAGRRRRGRHDQRRLPLSYSVGPLGGQVRAGLVADAWSVRGSIASGGALCVVGVVACGVWMRDFWRYDARTDVHAVRERTLRQAGAVSADDGLLPG